MGETAANILAPSDPTWNPPPMPVPDTVANPNPPSPDMLAARGTSDMPPAPPPMAPPDPNMITPAGAAAPYTPPQPAPPNPEQKADAHESFLHHILDKVGTILGGDETIHVTRDKDGNLTVTHDPSTTGEKWGRVAMAALGGAAKGAAASQGPGGLAKAASAGAEWGMQLPQQMRENADAQVTADQKRQMMNANNALIHQKAYQAMLDSQNIKTDIDTKSAGLINAYRDELASSPDAKDFGIISNPDDLMRIANQNTDFLHKHTNLELKAAMVPKKGGGFELHAIATDPGDDARPVKEGAPVLQISVDPKTQEPTLTSQPSAKGSRTKNQELRIANQSIITQYAGLRNSWDKNHKPATEKEPTTQDAAIIAKYKQLYPNDPVKALDMATREIQAGKEKLRSITNINNAPPTAEGLANWGTLLSDPQSGVTLANVKPEHREQVINAMKTAGQKIAKPLTSQELNRADLAHNAISNIERAQQILESRPDMFGPAGYGRTQFQKLLKGGDPDALAYQTAINLANLPAVGIHGVRGRWALEDLSKLDSNLYLNADSMRNVLNEIHRSASEFGDMGGRKRESSTAETAPTTNVTKPTGNTGQGVIVWPKTPAPQGHVWVAIPDQPMGHIPAGNVQSFKAKHPDAQVQP